MSKLMDQLMVITNLGLDKYCGEDIYYYGENELEAYKKYMWVKTTKKGTFQRLNIVRANVRTTPIHVVDFIEEYEILSVVK